MKVLIGCFLSTFLAVLYNNLYAQVISSSISGKVLTENHLPAISSTVILLKSADSSIVSSASIGKDGLFRFTDLNPSSYLVLVTSVGYNRSYRGPYFIAAGQNLGMADVILNPLPKQLNEVTIEGSRPDIEVKPGKITLNVPNSLTTTGSSAYDILRQSPGVRVDNGNISIVGRQNALITIDGKPSPLTGDDLVSLLKNIQYGMIDRIELVTSGSAKYDASAGGVINIVLRKGSNIGTNATVTASAGYGKYYKSNIGLTFNHRTESFNIFGSYSYSNDKTFHNFITDRVINFDNVSSNYHVDYNSLQRAVNNSFSLGSDFYLSSNHTIGFLVSGFVRQENNAKDDALKIYNQGVLDSVITASSPLSRHISSINYNLNYTGKLDKAGKTLSADVNYFDYDRNSAEYITNDFFDASLNPYRDPLLLQNLSPSTIHMWQSRIDFTDPISKTSKLEAGVKYSKATSNNDLIFGPQIDGQYTIDPTFSNHFLYTENVNSAYVNYENKFDKWGLVTGLRAEQTIAMGNSVTSNSITKSNYVNLFPQLQITYKSDDKNDFSLSYNRGILRPNYQALNPFLVYADLYDYSQGNPLIKPEYSNSVQLSYSYNKTYLATLYTTIISNADEFNFYEQDDTSKVSITTQRNLGTIYNYGIKFFIPVVFTSWWNANFNLDVSYQRYVAYPVNGTLNKGTQDVIFSSIQYFKISKTFSAELSGNYESPTFYGISQYKASYHVDAGLGKQLFENRGNLRLSIGDIFNTQRDRSFTNYQNLDLTTMNKKESQIGRLTFTYRFGKTSVKAVQHHTGNEEEQKRTKGDN